MRKIYVNGVKIYGRNQKVYWVKKYVIQYSIDEEIWYNYIEYGFVKVIVFVDCQIKIGFFK